jgi:hypothetical protein
MMMKSARLHSPDSVADAYPGGMGVEAIDIWVIEAIDIWVIEAIDIWVI